LKKPYNIYLVELIGIFGIIASLLFVGAQLVLERNIAYSTAFHDRVALHIANSTGMRDNYEYVQQRARALENSKPSWWNSDIESYVAQNELSMEDVVRLDIQAGIYLQITDNNYYQYELGLIDEATWEGMRMGFSGNLRYPIGKARILGAIYLRPSMKKMVEELVAEIEESTPAGT